MAALPEGSVGAPSPLEEILRRQIAAAGPLRLDAFMQLCLQHPEHGYYQRAAVLGRAGDFVTAPEISQMFGELIGLWLYLAWQAKGRPSSFTLLELGPGRGSLMADALRATGSLPEGDAFLAAKQLWLFEAHPQLRGIQAERLAAHQPRFVSLLTELMDRPLFFVANEFFDALPVRQWVRTENGPNGPNWVEEIGVDLVDGALAFCRIPLAAGERFFPSGAPDFMEASPEAQRIMADLARGMAAHGGAGLIVDYAYSTPPEASTLQAVRAQARVSPLSCPGETDLSAFVDYAALQKIAKEAGLKTEGPVSQGAFLHALGLEARAAQLAAQNPDKAKAIAEARWRLSDSRAMGNLFQVLAVTAGEALGLGF